MKISAIHFATLTGIVALFATKLPVLFMVTLYILIGYSGIKFIFNNLVAKHRVDKTPDSTDVLFMTIFALLWPLTFPIILMLEFDNLRKHFNLPYVRNPFYYKKDVDND